MGKLVPVEFEIIKVTEQRVTSCNSCNFVVQAQMLKVNKAKMCTNRNNVHYLNVAQFTCTWLSVYLYMIVLVYLYMIVSLPVHDCQFTCTWSSMFTCTWSSMFTCTWSSMFTCTWSSVYLYMIVHVYMLVRGCSTSLTTRTSPSNLALPSTTNPVVRSRKLR